MKPVRRLGRIASGVGATFWVALPLAVLASLLFLNTQLRLSAPIDTWVAAEPASTTQTTPIEFSLAWDTPPAPLAPSWEGLVQSVYVEPGAKVATGTKVVRISGVDRIGFAGKAPFWRPIEASTTGEDVAELNRLLTELGLRHGQGTTVTAATMAGVDQLRIRLGAADRSVFKPDWIIHLATAEVTVEKLDLTVAAPAPAAGTALLTPAASLTSARLVAKGSLPAQSAGSPAGQGSQTGQGGGTESSKEMGAKQSAADPSRPVGRPFTAPENGRVLSAGTALPVDTTRQAIASEGLPTLAKQLEKGTPSTSGLVESPLPPGALVLPASAVRTAPSGVHCVVRRDDGGSEGPVRVDVVGESQGRVVITGGDLTAGTLVLASTRKAAACE
ncbi:hypothetical protein SPF06_21755 [Sinomonas sp. JGH33]|uniref:Uncharacterized protein n=1 Tax=Sinomonas terricola TaxID=3110330 RepID=A0ABU5TCY3_9MICC|nr:hypothetical protein [Sinomonas sp. JGH33]MEA5457349.1 hypothetical protein [Sinomonas sp. JGH33]